MSVEIHLEHTTQLIVKLLEGVVKALEKNNQSQKVSLGLSLTFDTTKKKDC